MSFVTVEDLLATGESTFQEVILEEVPDKVFRIRRWRAGERMNLQTYVLKAEANKNYDAMVGLKLRAIALSLVDETGQRLFTDKDMDAHVKTLCAMDSAVMESLFERITKLNKFDKEAGEAAEKK